MLSVRILPAVSRTIITVIVAFVFCFEAHAASTLHLDKNQASYSLGKHVEYLEDRSGQMGIAMLRKLPEGVWRRYAEAIPNFGFTQSAFWFRIELSAVQSHKRLLEIDQPLLDEISLYLFSKGHLEQQIQTGDSKPYMDRPLKQRVFIFPLMMSAEPLTLYLRIQTSGSLQVPMTLWIEFLICLSKPS